ncbi:MAG: hypothetical protein AAB441_05320 [Patescibacteria group bacterium]
MKTNWQAKNLKERAKKFIIETIQENNKTSYQVAPIISGATSLILLTKVIFSNLEGDKFKWSIIIVFIMFITSAILYYFLRKLEKDKDIYLLSVVGRTVGDVFKRYGEKMAVKNAGFAKAADMNKIMQTIVNLVKSMKNLGDKKYVER